MSGAEPADRRDPAGLPDGVELLEVRVSSIVRAPPEAVWDRVSTMEGVNGELMPFVRMTYPPAVSELNPANVPLGRRLFRSWILLFGILPIDLHDLTLVRVESGRGFLESSTSLAQRYWVHERTLERVAEGCRVTDRIRFRPRLPVGALVLPVIRFLFGHRHRRLRRFFADQLPEETKKPTV